MAKAVLVTIDKQMLQMILGLPDDQVIEYAQMEYGWYQHPSVQLLISGDSLPDVFQVQDGMRVLPGNIVIHYEHRSCTITPEDKADG